MPPIEKWGYLAAALLVVFQQKNITWWFLYLKGMGLAKNLVFWTPPNVPSMYPMRIRLSYIIFKAPIFSKKVKMDIFSPN